MLILTCPCGKQFETLRYFVERRGRKYCSHACFDNYRPKLTLEERYWAKVDIQRPDECWPWKAGIMAVGYGKFGGAGGRRGKTRPAHQVAYELTYGPIPAGKQINHTCDFRPCQNPAHLYAGTKKQNTADAIMRGRLATKGSSNPMAKINDDIVIQIRRDYATGNFTQQKLGNRYGLSQPHIGQIVRGKKWSHVLI